MTVSVPVAAGAVSTPDEEIRPLVVVQVTAGMVVMAAPNWSVPPAVNCCVAPILTDTFAGLTLILVSVWLTVTVTLLVTVRLPGSLMVTRETVARRPT